MTDKIVILITAKNVRECGQIARHLLDKRLIACANLVPEVRSLYHWQGKVASEKLFVKRGGRNSAYTDFKPMRMFRLSVA